MRKPSQKVLAALLFLSLTSGTSVLASDATKGLETHTYDSSGISYDAKTDRWYYENTNGSIHEWVSGDVLRNVAVDKVTRALPRKQKTARPLFLRNPPRRRRPMLLCKSPLMRFPRMPFVIQMTLILRSRFETPVSLFLI